MTGLKVAGGARCDRFCGRTPGRHALDLVRPGVRPMRHDRASALPPSAHTYARWPDQPRALATLVSMSDHYRAPGWFTRNVFNQLVALLTRQGISVLGSRVLAVKGRTSGQWRTTPVNLLTYQGRRYLVAPRGETPGVRNLRALGARG